MFKHLYIIPFFRYLYIEDQTDLYI